MSTRSIITIFIGLALTPVQASAECPTNIARSSNPGGFEEIQSSAPIWNDNVVGGVFSLNLIAGTAQMICSGGGGKWSIGVSLQATDLYQIAGPGSADPIPFEVRVHLTGSVTAYEQSYPGLGVSCDGSSVGFVLTSGAATTQFNEVNGFQPCVGKTFVSDLVLPLAKLPGEPFPVQYVLQSGTSGGVGTIRGEVSFANLPAGYTITSCQGYVGQTVATMPTSWGRLKLVYR